jgi:hypothetical protein
MFLRLLGSLPANRTSKDMTRAAIVSRIAIIADGRILVKFLSVVCWCVFCCYGEKVVEDGGVLGEETQAKIKVSAGQLDNLHENDREESHWRLAPSINANAAVQQSLNFSWSTKEKSMMSANPFPPAQPSTPLIEPLIELIEAKRVIRKKPFMTSMQSNDSWFNAWW